MTRIEKPQRVLTVVVAAALAMASSARAQSSSFAVTLRFGARVIGPDSALAVVVPGASGGGDRDVWITLPPGAAAARLDSVVQSDAGRRRTLGTCDVVARDAHGTVLRSYHLTGCYVSRVERAGDMRRVALGYLSISTS